ncbi:MAG: diguanylate cyclase [Burkholderiales bacterium]|nr:diguanylate cyclase [Burkholderiales bacterium]
MKPAAFQPITHALIRRALKWAVLCTLVFGGLQAWLAYQNVQRDFQSAVRGIATTHVPLLSLAIWDIEPRAIQGQIDLLLESSQIAYASVKVNTGQQFAGGKAGVLNGGTTLRFQIPPPNKQVGAIGTLELVLDRSVLYRQLIHSVLLVLLESIVLTALLLGTGVLILRRNLAQPMRQLAEFVTSLKADNLSPRLQLERPAGHSYDEIDMVAEGFQTLQASIQRHISTLDAQVQERTQQLETALASLKTLSGSDQLTGCYNRSLFSERFPSEMNRAQRYAHPLSVIFCDVDHFKVVNDTHGHLTGDRVLAMVGHCLRQELRAEVDWVVRYGGEEFLVVLPETALPAALEAAERLRLGVRRGVRLQLDDRTQLQISASFGVAEREAADDMASLVQRADQWLYAAKRGGRNQVQPQR